MRAGGKKHSLHVINSCSDAHHGAVRTIRKPRCRAHNAYLANADGLTALRGRQAAQNLKVLQEQQEASNRRLSGIKLASSGTDRKVVNKQY